MFSTDPPWAKFLLILAPLMYFSADRLALVYRRCAFTERIREMHVHPCEGVFHHSESLANPKDIPAGDACIQKIILFGVISHDEPKQSIRLEPRAEVGPNLENKIVSR